MKLLNRIQHLSVMLLAVLLMLAITSCNWIGQGNKADQGLDNNEKKETQWIDPLFKIDG